MNNITKVLFPDGVEAITISKNDYDRLYGELSYQNIKLQSNWNSLKDWVSEHIDSIKFNSYDKVLDKMNELEKSDNK